MRLLKLDQYSDWYTAFVDLLFPSVREVVQFVCYFVDYLGEMEEVIGLV